MKKATPLRWAVVSILLFAAGSGIVVLFGGCASSAFGRAPAGELAADSPYAGETVDAGPLAGRRVTRFPEPAAENILQYAGVRVGYPADWRAYTAAEPQSQGAFLLLKDRFSNHYVRIDHFAFERSIDPRKFTALAVELLRTDTPPPILELAHQDRAVDLVEWDDGTLAVVYQDTEAWIIEGRLRAGTTPESARRRFMSVLASFRPVESAATARFTDTGVRFYGIDRWRWIGDTDDGFLLETDSDETRPVSGAAVIVVETDRPRPEMREIREGAPTIRYDRLLAGIATDGGYPVVVAERGSQRLVVALRIRSTNGGPPMIQTDDLLLNPSVSSLIHGALLILEEDGS